MIAINEDRENETLVQFGHGTLSLSTATLRPADYPNEIIIIAVEEPGEVGNDNPTFNAKPTNTIGNPMVRLQFHNLDSVQVLMDALEKIKANWDKPQSYIYVKPKPSDERSQACATHE